MRKKDKYILGGATIVFGITAIVDVIMQYVEHKKKGLELTWKTFDLPRTLKHAFTGGLIGAAGGYLVYQVQLTHEKNTPFNKDKYLKRLLNKHSFKSDPELFDVLLKKRNELKEWLEYNFSSSLAAKPQDAGSFRKRTSILLNSDLDIVLPFKKNSYSSLKEMYDDVHWKISRKFGRHAVVEEGTKSISITFPLKDFEIYVDIVPGREINDFAREKDLNLYVRPEWFWQKGSSFKTNLSSHTMLTKNKPQARRVIKLVKIYREANDLYLPSILVEQLVIDAFEKGNYSFNGSDYNNFLNCLEYISKKIDSDERVVDISNSNNDISNKLEDLDRDRIVRVIEGDLDNLDYNPRFLREMFES